MLGWGISDNTTHRRHNMEIAAAVVQITCVISGAFIAYQIFNLIKDN